MRSSSSQRLLLLSILTSLLVTSGCYTLLKHPSPEGPQVADYSRCSECHHNYYMSTSYNPYYSGPWWDYYSIPWWYNDLLVVTEEGHEIPMREVLSTRNAERRKSDSSQGFFRQIVAPSRNGDQYYPTLPDHPNLSEPNGEEEEKTAEPKAYRERVIRKREYPDRSNKSGNRRSTTRRTTRKRDDSTESNSSTRENSGTQKNNSSREKRKK
jgi:hypothetical protein